MEKNNYFTVNNITYVLMLSLSGVPAYAVDFNTDVLDAVDRKNIDISRFSQVGYIMPGQYQMELIVNGQNVSPTAFSVTFLERPTQGKGEEQSLPQPCLTPEMVNRMGLTEESQEKVTYWNNEQCADLNLLPGAEIRPNTAQGMLHINMPQAWLEYLMRPGYHRHNGMMVFELLFDYNINGAVNKPHQGGQSQSLSYYGTTGINAGAWRLRGDYQGNLNHTTGNAGGRRVSSPGIDFTCIVHSRVGVLT